MSENKKDILGGKLKFIEFFKNVAINYTKELYGLTLE